MTKPPFGMGARLLQHGGVGAQRGGVGGARAVTEVVPGLRRQRTVVVPLKRGEGSQDRRGVHAHAASPHPIMKR
jgi:hypothetical protein